jgi:type I restriction enzyme S subunit
MKRWPTKPLGEVLEVSRERIEPTAHPQTSFNYVGLENIESHTGKLLPYQPTPGVKIKSTKNVFRCHDILYGKLRPYLNKVHLANEAGICSTDIYVLRTRHGKIQPSFAAYYLRSASVLGVVSNAMAGANLPRIGQQVLLDISVPVPPLEEQERIVKLLDEADELRKLRTKADRRTADLVPALFHEMFGDPTHLEKMHWPFKPMSQFAEVSYGLADKLDASTKPEDGTRILTISNVLLSGTINTKIEKYSIIEPAQRAKARLQKLDLLFNWRNGSEEHVGKTAIWEEQIEGDILHVSFLLKIRSDQTQANPYFLWALLNRLRATGYFTRNARMQINRKFNASELSALKLPLPALPLQQEFAQRVTEIRELEAEQSTSRKRLEGLFQSVLHGAFAGEL